MTEGKTEDIAETILYTGEKWWTGHRELLESRGYRLRARYQPDWRPSWLASDKSPLECEDGYAYAKARVIDAVHISTGKRVFMKAVKKGTTEKSIVMYLNSEDLLRDPRNHCVRILDSFESELDPEEEIIVMPLLRPFNMPSFDTVEEAFDFVRQMLENVVFIHEKNVAHRDLCKLNIMYDAEEMFPMGFHPVFPPYTSDIRRTAPYITRTAVGGVKYFVTDFGISTQFKEGDTKLVLGESCQDHSVPELSNTRPYDPFRVDIYTLGNVFKEDLIDYYTNIKPLVPLMQAMTHLNPEARPTAVEALQMFEEIAKRQPIHVVKWKLKRVKTHRIVHLYQNCISVGTVSAAYIRWLTRPFLCTS